MDAERRTANPMRYRVGKDSLEARYAPYMDMKMKKRLEKVLEISAT
jgi:hypothetical protein